MIDGYKARRQAARILKLARPLDSRRQKSSAAIGPDPFSVKIEKESQAIMETINRRLRIRFEHVEDASLYPYSCDNYDCRRRFQPTDIPYTHRSLGFTTYYCNPDCVIHTERELGQKERWDKNPSPPLPAKPWVYGNKVVGT